MSVNDKSPLNNIPGMVPMEPARVEAFAKIFESHAKSTLAPAEKKARARAAAARQGLPLAP